MASGDEKRDSSPVVDWGNVGWDDPAPVAKAARPRPRPKPVEAKVEVEPEVEPEIELAAPPEPADWQGEAAEAQWVGDARSTTEPAAKGGPLIGRALLMLIAAGYLAVVAFLCYEALGGLHSEAAGANGARLAELQSGHATIAKLMMGNGAAAGLFALAGFFLLFGGGRALGKLLLFCGAAFLIGFVFWQFKHAQPYMREFDLLYKMIIISFASMSLR